MASGSSIFDMIGPVMIGPSSSHTAGVVRIGRAAHHILGETPTEALITFYNSFATTYEGHGSDRAILAGLMDYPTDDIRIRDAQALAKEAGINYTYRPVGNASTLHPNTIRLQLKASSGKSLDLFGQSLGGGVIRISEVNGFTANITASSYTAIILAKDVPGSIAFIASVFSHDDCNIATLSCSRKGKNDLACLFFEMDTPPRPITLQYLKDLSWVEDLVYLEPLN